MKENEINPKVAEAISHLDEFQQLKLLEFINAIIGTKQNQMNALLKYAGSIELPELRLMEQAIADCEKIDKNDW